MGKIGLLILSVLFLNLASFITANGQNQVIVVTSSGDTIDLTGSKVHVIGNNGTVDIDEKGNVRERRQVKPSMSSDDEIYESVDQMPIFPGGEVALMKYISNHMQYPTMAKENLIEGKVIVQFVVTKTGRVGEVRIAHSVDPDLDREAVRVCKSLPNFVPGRQNGTPVAVWYTMPIIFKL